MPASSRTGIEISPSRSSNTIASTTASSRGIVGAAATRAGQTGVRRIASTSAAVSLSASRRKISRISSGSAAAAMRRRASGPTTNSPGFGRGGSYASSRLTAPVARTASSAHKAP